MRRFRTSRLWLALRHRSQPPSAKELSTTNSKLAHSDALPPEHAESIPRVDIDHSVALGENNKIPHPITRLPTELLQHIFSYLDLDSLLRYQRVCKLWNACIPGSSPSIRAAMFLPSASDTVLSDPNMTFHFTVFISAFFLELYPCSEPPMAYTLVPRVEAVGVTMHPMITAGMHGGQVNQMVCEWKFLHGEKWRIEMPGSWTDMLACYPPVRRMRVKFAYEDDVPVAGFIEYDLHAEEGEVVARRDGEGILLGEFVMRVAELLNIR